jgi:hypothetical protein
MLKTGEGKQGKELTYAYQSRTQPGGGFGIAGRRICATDALIKHGELTTSVDSHQIAHIVGQQ